MYRSGDGALNIGDDSAESRVRIVGVEIADLVLSLSNLQQTSKVLMSNMASIDSQLQNTVAESERRNRILRGQMDQLRWTNSAWRLGMMGQNFDDKLYALQSYPHAYCGVSVAMRSEQLVIGCSGHDVKVTDSGSVFVFERVKSSDGSRTFEEKYRINPDDGDRADYFGVSVATDGHTLVVGAHLDDDNGENSGSVYVHQRNNNTGIFEETSKLTASVRAAGVNFGQSVALDTNVLFVGADKDVADGISNAGSVYVFERDDMTDAFEEIYKITASDATAGDRFGASVSADKNVLVVGAPNVGNFGSAYVFEKSDTTGIFEEMYKLAASDAVVNCEFATSVAIDGDRLVVGAIGLDAGVVYVFAKDHVANKFIEKYKLVSSDATTGDLFGRSLSIFEDVLVVGSHHDSDQGQSSGSVYVFPFNWQLLL